MLLDVILEPPVPYWKILRKKAEKNAENIFED